MRNCRVSGRWRLWGTLAVVGGLLPASAATAQNGEKQPIKLMAHSPKVAVFLRLTASAQSRSRLDLMVRTAPPLEQPPSVLLLDGGQAVPRAQKVERDPKSGDWIGAVELQDPFGSGAVRVEIPTEKNAMEQHVTTFALRGVAREIGSALYSADGRFTLLMSGEKLSDGTRFLVTRHEQPQAPLPPGAILEAGPFEVSLAGPEVAVGKSLVAIQLGQALDRNAKDGPADDLYQVRWWNPDSKAWDVLPSGLDPRRREVQAQTTHIGTFVLTSVRK